MRTRRTAWMAGVSLCLLVLVGCGAPAPSVPPKPIHIRFAVTDLGIVPPFGIARIAPASSGFAADGRTALTRARTTLPSLDHAQPILASRGSPSPIAATATPTVAPLSTPNAPSDVAGINRYGQVAGNLGDMGFLWTPTTPNGTTGQLIDFNQILAPPSATVRVRVQISKINNYGQVAGDVEEQGIEQTNQRAFLWTPNAPNSVTGTLTDLSPLMDAFGLNDWGQVVANSPQGAGLWTPTRPNGVSGILVPIPPPSGDTSSEAYGINSYGQVIGDSSDSSDTVQHAFVWTPSAPHGMTGTTTPIDGDGSDVTAINDYGQVLGSVQAGNQSIWTPSSANGTHGQLTRIGPLFGDGDINFFNIGPSGAAIGVSFGIFRLFPHPGFGGNHAVVWMPAARNGTTGKLLTLGAVGNDADSGAGAINSSGEVVGSSCTLRIDGPGTPYCTTQPHVFIWDDKHGLHDLQRLIDPRAGMTLGESVETIESISDAGQIVIEGQAPDSQTHLLLLTPQP